MNSNPIFILDTFRISRIENPLLPFHIQRTFEAIHLIRSDVSHQEICDLYNPFKFTSSPTDQKCRLTIDPQTIKILQHEVTPIDLLNDEIKLDFATHRQQKPGQGLQNYKTTDRKYWDNNLAVKWPGTEDIIGINELNQATETSRFNLFLKKQDQIFTPSLNSGCINGCFRRSALTAGFVEINRKKYSLIEKDFLYPELSEAEIYVGNSLRGLIKASLAIDSNIL